MKRPLDINGDEIIMGNWYWVQDRRGKIFGTGKFCVMIGSNFISFSIGNSIFLAEDFLDYAPVGVSPESLFGVQQ
jgi:hypothetical protein